MALNQFGAVMTFAIELESSLADFYRKASAEQPELQEKYLRREKDSLSRKKKLEKSRRENVTEIILEPIEGINRADFVLDLATYTPDHIQSIEKIVTTFYDLTQEKINVFETKRVLKRCARQHKAYLS